MTERRSNDFLSLPSVVAWANALPVGGTHGWARLAAAARERTRSAVGRVGKREVGIALLVLLVWLANVKLPAGIVAPALDSSWAAALGHALRSRMQFGVDLVFTYGPLGSMYSGIYDPDLFGLRVLVWECGLGLLVASLLTRLVLRIPGILERTVAFLLLLILPISPFQYEQLGLTAAAALLLDRSGRRPGWILGMTLVLAALSLAKFTNCASAMGCIAAVAAGRWTEGERKIALGVVAAFGSWLLLLWRLCGQSLASLPSYFRASVQLSSGYQEGMSTYVVMSILLLALSLLGLLLLLVLTLVAARKPRGTHVAFGACLLIGAFVAFKSGFVRASFHTPFFFGWAAIAGFLFATPEEVPAWRRIAATYTRLSLAVLGVVGIIGWRGSSPFRANALVPDCSRRIFASVEGLLDLKGFQAACEGEARKQERDHALLRTRERVGNDGIDMLSFEQGVLFLNGLHWQPRPVFQGYCAMTPDLLVRNARFLESERAPPWVLFRLETIDGRLPTMDDGLALQVLARDWQPVLEEKGLLLLRRAPRDEAADPPKIVLERRIGFGERVELPIEGGTCHVLSLEIRYTLLGRIVKALVRAPQLFLRVETDAGETSDVRIVPGMMRTGAIIDPWLPSQRQWLDWTTGERMDRTVAVTVRGPDALWMYQPAIDIQLTRRNGIAPVIDPSLERDPTAIPSRLGVEGKKMLARAPSDIHFDLARGEHVVRGKFGLLPKAWLQDGSPLTAFSLVVEDANGARQFLLSRRLDPGRKLADRGSQEFEIRFSTRSHARLHLITGPRPSGDDPDAWPWWDSVEIEGAIHR